MNGKDLLSFDSSEEINLPSHPVDPAPIPPVVRRAGKIGRLPNDIREKINEMLLDGVEYETIIERLGRYGDDLNKMNVSNWANGGYQDFLKKEAMKEAQIARHQFTLEILSQDDSIDTFYAAEKIAASTIAEALGQIGTEGLKAACKANPLNLLRMINALPRLAITGMKCHDYTRNDSSRHQPPKALLEALPVKPGKAR
jgi:hypothetical protein